jgi:hypothetical protein
MYRLKDTPNLFVPILLPPALSILFCPLSRRRALS